MLEESRLRYERVKGVPHIRDPGNSRKRFTGAWRTFMPVWDMKKCVKCRKCWLYCPDSAIDWKGKPVWNSQVCKGCMICYEVCPVKAISKVRDMHTNQMLPRNP